jgi:UDP:flavonoid glycosyltransferase YjiC (YdhE family)
MRFLLATIGSAGDVYPFVAVGRRLAARGHDVAVLTHTAHGDLVRRGGLEFVDLDDAEPYRALYEHPWYRHPIRSNAVTTGFVVDSMRRQFEKVREWYVPGETVLCSMATSFGVRIFQEVYDAPHVTALFAPMPLRSHFRPSKMPFGWWPEWTPPFVNRIVYRAIDALGVDRALGGINTFRRELGLRPVSRFLHEWWLSPSRILGLFPDWFCEPIPSDWPPQLRMTGFPLYDAAEVAPLDPVIEQFLTEGPKPAIVTGGSWLRDRRFFESAVEGCRRAGLRCIVQTPFRELLAERLPDNVVHTRYVPFGALMPRAAALVHHGGVGTLSQALAAGIPQVVIPQNFDQRDNAARLVRLGVAAWPSNGHARPAVIARSLATLLESRTRQAVCKSFADRTRTDAIDAACQVLECRIWPALGSC